MKMNTSNENLLINRSYVKQDLEVFYGVVPNWEQLDVKGIIENYRKNNPQSNTSNVKAWHSGWDTHKRDPNFHPLIRLCEQFCYNAFEGNGATFPAPLVLIDFWCMQYDKGEHAAQHQHWPSTLSVCYYADVGDGCSPLRFRDGSEITPQNGMIIAFHGMVTHEVPPTDSHRTCVAMNFAVSTKGFLSIK